MQIKQSLLLGGVGGGGFVFELQGEASWSTLTKRNFLLLNVCTYFSRILLRWLALFIFREKNEDRVSRFFLHFYADVQILRMKPTF